MSPPRAGTPPTVATAGGGDGGRVGRVKVSASVRRPPGGRSDRAAATAAEEMAGRLAAGVVGMVAAAAIGVAAAVAVGVGVVVVEVAAGAVAARGEPSRPGRGWWLHQCWRCRYAFLCGGPGGAVDVHHGVAAAVHFFFL